MPDALRQPQVCDVFPRRPLAAAAEIDVGAPRAPFVALQGMPGFKELQNSALLLQGEPTNGQEEAFQQLERRWVKQNAAAILPFAEAVSGHLKELMGEGRRKWDSLHHFRCLGCRSREDALVYRCIYVPLAYRLGYYTLAAKLAQMTFETLFPELEERVRRAVERCTGYGEVAAHALVHERFTIADEHVLCCYSRPKSPHSIWKKAGSAPALEAITPQEFSERINDCLGVAWIMAVRKGENRFDALIEAARLFCSDPELTATVRRRACHMTEGFPVMMLHCVWRGMPVEVQFLGGHVMGWLAAMDYAKYKVGTSLDDVEQRLSTADWTARGESLLRMYEKGGVSGYEEGNSAEFHELLLTEAAGLPTAYDQERYQPPACSPLPQNPLNRGFRWPDDAVPLCLAR